MASLGFPPSPQELDSWSSDEYPSLPIPAFRYKGITPRRDQRCRPELLFYVRLRDLGSPRTPKKPDLTA